MRSILGLLIGLITTIAFSQYDANHPPNTYRSTQNPFYWKNSLPHAGYWQQDVHYQIEATIHDSLDMIDAEKFKLEYWNNSPDTLNEVFFHLYQNAFTPESYLSSNYLNNNKVVEYGKYEAQGLGTTVENIAVNGIKVETELDNTILKVSLPQPLPPGFKATITMKFKSYFDRGTLRRRMKMFEHDGVKHYDGVHWYPSIAVYDQKFGWTTEQHLDKEFYSNFGTFDIKLTFPNDYIVDGTGTLQNEDEVLPIDLREKIDLSNFLEKSTSISKPVIKDHSKPKTWHFYAENVHNFAFTADPTYRIGQVSWNGISVVTLAQEPNAWGWEKSGDFTQSIVKTYSEDFGMYAWPKIIIADARDGMEYPMLTLNGGVYNIRQQYLLAHEVGHMWFYGMVGTNETYRAMMDEGFTQFLTVWGMDKVIGATYDYKEGITPKSKNKHILKNLPPRNHRYERLYYPYLKQVHRNYDHNLNAHSSQFNGAVRHGGGYGLVYYKTGVMLYNLKYVLGEELFLKAMKYYFDKWKMKHPYPEDFRQAIVEYTKTDLNWFFDQWMESTKYIDYGIESVKRAEGNTYKIIFERRGRMQMPLDFIVINDKGDTIDYHIPNTWFNKKTNAQILTKWWGFDNVKPTYEAVIQVEGKLANVIIDPERLMADIDLRNNSWKEGTKIGFDNRVASRSEWKHASILLRPDIWYNNYDGLQLGAAFKSNYFDETNFYEGAIWWNSGLGQYDIPESEQNGFRTIAFYLSAKQHLRKIWNQFYSFQHLEFNAGLAHAKLGLEKTFKKKDLYRPEYSKVSLYGNFLNRYRSEDFLYPIYFGSPFRNDLFRTADWYWNNSLNIDIEHHYRYKKGKGDILWQNRAQSLDFYDGYAYTQITAINENKLGQLDLRTRFFGRLGSSFTPIPSAVLLNGANLEELSYNKFTRAAGFFPSEFENMHLSGGLNVRGFSYVNENGFTPVGRSGIGTSVELDFDRLIRLRKRYKALHLDTYFFADAGALAVTKFATTRRVFYQGFDHVAINAGIGTTLTVKFPGYDIKPFQLRFDVPFLKNEPEGFQGIDWVLGIGRSF